MNDLIDTTEMYLKTIYELDEEGITPLRARIAERLHQSGPTVSQTTARMQRDGLLTIQGDRHLELTEEGRQHAVEVMRKHRLASLLLVEVLGMEWEKVHNEACRWEHVMSTEVEQRIVAVLGAPTVCPHGNPIPGLDAIGAAVPAVTPMSDLARASDVATTEGTRVLLERIGEPIQPDERLMYRFRQAGILPGHKITLAVGENGLLIEGEEYPSDVGQHLFVRVS